MVPMSNQRASDDRVVADVLGAGIGPGRVMTPARTIDVAPTLAALLGIRVPKRLDGRTLGIRRAWPEGE